MVGGRQAEVGGEDGVDGLGGGDEGEDAHVGAAVGAGEGEDLVDAGEEAGPAGAGGGVLWRDRQVGGAGALGSAGLRRQVVACGAAGRVARRLGVVAAEADNTLAQACVRSEDAVVAVAVDPGRRDESAQSVEKLEWQEGEDGAAVAGGPRGVVEDLATADGQRWQDGVGEVGGHLHHAARVAGGADAAARAGELGLALRTLPLGTAYAVWTGIGTVGTALLGIYLFREPATAVRLFCIALIVAGIVGLELAPVPSAAPPASATPVPPRSAL